MGNIQSVKELLGAGADPDAQGNDGKIPLDVSIRSDFEGITKLLFRKSIEKTWPSHP